MQKQQLKSQNLPKGWRKVKLGDYLDLVRGISYSSCNLLKSRDSVFLVNLKNINRGGGFKKEGLKNYSGEYKIEQLVEKDDIVVAMTDLTPQSEVIGMPALVPEIEKKACISMDIIKLSFKREGIDKKFLYYLLTDRNYKSWIRGFANGVNVLHLNSNGITDYTPVIPRSLDEQRHIASILSAFDDKIELNNKINRTLEEMAQAIFKHWFVDFKFPGYEKTKFVNSELGKIPEGWGIKNIMEIIKRLPVGKKYSNKTALPKGKVPILDQGESGIIGYHNEEPSVVASVNDPVIVFSNHTCYYHLITYNFSCIQNIIPYIGINGYPTLFVYYLTKNKIKMSDYKGHWPEFAAQKFIIPPQELAIKFAEIIQPFVAIISKNQRENQKLTELRDLLLPKLMSGEIKIL